jgi:FKBP-type peptidyl-prolyl cis-trans isomerase
MKAAFAVLGLIVAACHAENVPGLDTTYTIIKEPTVHPVVEGAAPVNTRRVRKGQTAEVHLIGMVKETEAGTGYKFIDTKEDEEKEAHHIQAGVEGTDVTGLTQGIVSMGLGEVRKFEIPPHEGYGDVGVPAWKIPAQATLIYTVELLDILHDAGESLHDEL